MSFIVTSKKSQGGVYDQATDPGAGMPGIVALGVYLPLNSVVTRFYIKTVTSVTTVAGTIEFSLGIAGPKLFNATPGAAFAAGTIIAGVDLNANPTGLSPIAVPQVTMTIGLGALLTGKLVFIIEYNEMDL